MIDRPPIIPRRHGADVATGRRIGRSLRWMIRGDAEPGAERWQALGAGLMRGDPPADRLLEWMQAEGMARSMPLFQRALKNGIASLPDPPAPLRDFFLLCETDPPWLDRALLAEGSRISQSWGLRLYYALRDGALMPGYQAAAFNKTLILTGALEGGTPRRVAETMQWVVSCLETGGMKRDGEGFRSTLHVRLMHAVIRKRIAAMPQWRSDEDGLPINQTDMAATNCGFSVVGLLGVRALGVPVTRGDARAVMHAWKYINWLMGVEEQWLTDDEMEGRRMLHHMLLAQSPPDETSKQLGRALMEETLHVPYPHLRGLRARFEQARHLSVTRLFVGAHGMRNLGLPAGVLPWYPLLSAPFTFVWQLAHRLTVAGRRRAARVGHEDVVKLVRLHFAGLQPRVGSLMRA